MKKIITCMLICVITAAFVACGTKEDKPVDTTAPDDETVSVTPETDTETIISVIEAKNCFNDAGFIEFISGANETSEYTFTAENSESVEWSVYILDEAFDDSFKYIKQAAEPVLVGDGTAAVKQGQYVYIYCSANEYTTGVADENATLKITSK